MIPKHYISSSNLVPNDIILFNFILYYCLCDGAVRGPKGGDNSKLMGFFCFLISAHAQNSKGRSQHRGYFISYSM